MRIREALRFNGALKGATVSRTAHAWFVAILVETDDLPLRCESQAAVGVDVGFKTLAMLSDGTSFEGPRALDLAAVGARQPVQALQEHAQGSANRKKSACALAHRLRARRRSA